MQRRTNAVSGWVNFPVNDPTWTSTNEGGMVVKLVVYGNEEFYDKFVMCCGAQVYDIGSEVLVGDDKPTNVKTSCTNSLEDEDKGWISNHYPHLFEDDIESSSIDKYTSRDYLAAIVLGTTGWSGAKTSGYEYWKCTFDDLTVQGKALYKQIEMLYPGAEIHLLTYLDT
jgi:hypothetical protein